MPSLMPSPAGAIKVTMLIAHEAAYMPIICNMLANETGVKEEIRKRALTRRQANREYRARL